MGKIKNYQLKKFSLEVLKNRQKQITKTIWEIIQKICHRKPQGYILFIKRKLKFQKILL